MRHIAQGRGDVDTLAVQLTTADMAYLTHQERIAIITYVGEGWYVPNEEEQTLIKLIQTSPNPKGVITSMQANNASLLRTLIKSIDGEEHKQLHELLRSLKFATLSPAEANAEMESAQTFPWADPGLIGALYNGRFYYEKCRLEDDGKLHIQYWANFLFAGIKQEEQVVDPFDMIRVYFMYPEDHAKAEAGESVFMPAINLYGLVQKQYQQELGLVVDMALMMTGVGALNGASKLGKIVGAIELAYGATDIAVREFRSQISDSAEGKQFLGVWDRVSTVMMIYGAARILTDLPGLFQELRSAWRRYRSGAGRNMDPNAARSVDEQIDEMVPDNNAVREAIEESGVGPGWGEAWDPPKNWNGPRNHGEWTGPRGNSSWVDDREEVIRIVGRGADGKANPIIFYKGRVDFTPYKQGELRVPGLKGTSADSNHDMDLIYRAIMEQEKLSSKAAARRWLNSQPDGYGGTGLSPHHAGGDVIELIPRALHKVQHTDMSIR